VRAAVAIALLGLVSCGDSKAGPRVVHAQPPATAAPARSSGNAAEVRATGKIQAARQTTVQVPRISAQSGRMTLVRFVPTGATVREGDILAEFDPTETLDQMRETKARIEDQNNQLAQRRSENRSNEAKRE